MRCAVKRASKRSRTRARSSVSIRSSAATAERMVATLPTATLVTVPRVGHVPTLAEPDALGAVEQLLARMAEPG